MNPLLPTFVLPDLQAGALGSISLAGSNLQVPCLQPEHVVAQWRGLDEHAAPWRAESLATRAHILAQAAQALRRAGPGDWEDLLVRSTGLSRPGLRVAWDVTFAPWDAAGIEALLEQEGIAATPASQIPRRILHILAGNVLPPTFALLARGFLLGSAQWIRPAAREPLFATCIVERLAAHCESMARTVAVLWWPHGDRIEGEVMRGAEVITATGDDTTLATLCTRATTEAPTARWVGYGSRWSLALLSTAAQTDANAKAVAWDVALFDQQGCLSPGLVLAEDNAQLPEWCASLAGAFGNLESELPRGALSSTARAGLRLWHERQRLGLATGEVRRLWEGAGTSWAVSLQSRPRWEDSPLDRHVPVVPFRSAGEILSLLGDRVNSLQGAAVDLAGWDATTSGALLKLLRPSRVARPGVLQLAPPAWMQDHLPPLRALLRR